LAGTSRRSRPPAPSSTIEGMNAPDYNQLSDEAKGTLNKLFTTREEKLSDLVERFGARATLRIFEARKDALYKEKPKNR